jgi:DNA polymerase-3 subunit gamma/tau
MSYQVLARKWRPKLFEDMVGQSHVVRALSNALRQDRLHHAYLFTGTRGVGKTTLARILAKALNCEEGVSATPCGRCSACLEIDGGRFVDLLEVDAASRTKVDQTRELLDNVPFAPVKGRFKVYLIDEVHMFSASSFNALLKTLEEPPPHVKFLLATTDPQKMPVTVLSRCLQFNLKRLIPEEIGDQLARILAVEGIAFEDQALALLARAADGSMRDGLSLLDQAIAYGAGHVRAEEVRAMLGTVGRDMSLHLVRALAALDGVRVLEEVARIHQLTPDFEGLLKELLSLLHRIALYQQVPEALSDEDPDRDELKALAAAMDPQDLQLFYQIALLGQQDLRLAPDPRTGLEMVLLRMLAFRPVGDGDGKPGASREGARVGSRPVPASPQREPAASSAAAKAPAEPVRAAEAVPTTAAGGGIAGDGSAISTDLHPANEAIAAARRAIASGRPASRESRPPEPSAVREETPSAAWGAARVPARQPVLNRPEDWQDLVPRLELGGIASELARNCALAGWDGSTLVLNLDPPSQRLRVEAAEQRLRESLARALGEGLRLEIRVSRSEGETPSQRRSRERAERQASAEHALASDLVVDALRRELGARVIPGTVAPVGGPLPGRSDFHDREVSEQ